MLEETMYL